MKPVKLISFAFSKGIPEDATMVFNARFLKPPASVTELQQLTGRDPEVGIFLESDPDIKKFFSSMIKMVSIFLPRYWQRYSEPVVIAIGCTGGQHRSVYLVQKLSEFLKAAKHEVVINHRELDKYENKQR